MRIYLFLDRLSAGATNPINGFSWVYAEKDFKRIIEIREREAKRVKVFMDEANHKEKAIVFCPIQAMVTLNF